MNYPAHKVRYEQRATHHSWSFMREKHGVPNPLISIIVPIFNVEKYILRTLESIARQSYKNYEVIIIDDDSQDGTYSIALDFCKKNSKFKIYRNERNLKIADTLNKALTYAQGSFIARCDGDDIMESDRLQRQMEWLQAHPDISLVGCSFSTIDETDTVLRFHDYPSGPGLLSRLLPYCSPVSHIWLSRREVYEVLKGYRMPTVEDYDFLLRANSAGFKFDNIPNYYGMRIRVRSGNTVGTYGIAQRRLFNYAKKVNLTKELEYSEKIVQEIIDMRQKGVAAWLHRKSDKVSQRASQSHSAALRLTLHGIAGLISPLKGQYYFNNLVKILLINWPEMKRLHSKDKA